ncbi:MAG: hypothetical protein HYX34_05870 [Actinobacteria bacterium]|nr:hypothetical protein [Actinomycetota bacterium]
MPEIPTAEDVTNFAKEALYVGVGLGVLTFQKLQVRRREIERELADRFAGVRAQAEKLGEATEEGAGDARARIERLAEVVEDRISELERRFDDLETQLDGYVAALEAKLPEQAAELVKQAREAVKAARASARDAAREARGQVRTLLAA